MGKHNDVKYVKQDGSRGAEPTGNRKGPAEVQASNTLVPKKLDCYNSNDNSQTPIGIVLHVPPPPPPALGTGNKPVVDPAKSNSTYW